MGISINSSILDNKDTISVKANDTFIRMEKTPSIHVSRIYLFDLFDILKPITHPNKQNNGLEKILSDTYIIISDGIDTNIQLYSCLGKMYNYIKDTSWINLLFFIN